MNARRCAPFIVSGSLVVLLAAAAPCAAALSVGAPASSPTSIPAGSPTAITVTVLVTRAAADPACQGVNLLRVNAAGSQAILGTMRDDGVSPDSAAGDGVYTLRATITEPGPAPLYIQASAAFQGQLARIKSAVTSVAMLQPEQRIVGPAGGIVGYPNGVFLNVPAGALSEPTVIEITNPPATMEQINQIFTAKYPVSHQKRVMGGFVGKPEGLQFKLPVKASLPVAALMGPKGIPIQAEVQFNQQTYWIEPSQLTYDPLQHRAEITISHFSSHVVVEATADFDPAAPCTGGVINVVSASDSFARDNCEIVTDTVQVTFRSCPGSPVFRVLMGEVSAGCPKQLIVESRIEPSQSSAYICQSSSFTSLISAKDMTGRPVIPKGTIAANWTSSRADVADFRDALGEVGTLDAKTEGTITVTARNPLDSDTATFTAKGYGAMTITASGANPGYPSLRAGDTVNLTAAIADLCGPLAPKPCAVTWTATDNKVTVSAQGVVTGMFPGETSVLATYGHCGHEFTSTIPVSVQVPDTFALRAKLAACDWDAPFCAFDSLSNPGDVTVLVTGFGGVPVQGADVQVSLLDYLGTATPATGRTNAQGEFRARISGLAPERPYIIAAVTATVGSITQNTVVRAITTDFCVNGVAWTWILSDTPTEPTGTLFDATAVTQSGDGSMSGFVQEPGNFSINLSASASTSGAPTGSYWGINRRAGKPVAGWWDTVMLIPEDLKLLDTFASLSFQLDTTHSNNTVSSGEANANNFVAFYYVTTYGFAESDSTCFAGSDVYIPNWGVDFHRLQISYRRSTKEPPAQDVTLCVPTRLTYAGSSLTSFGNVFRIGMYSWNMLAGASAGFDSWPPPLAGSAASSLSVTHRWTMVPPNGFRVHSCSGKFTTGH